MHVIIEESRAEAYLAVRDLPDSRGCEQCIRDGTTDLVFWTDASAKGQHQTGPSGAAIVFRAVDETGHVVWKQVTFGILGQRNIHQVELLAILYALRIALKVCTEKRDAAEAEAGSRPGGQPPSEHDDREPVLGEAGFRGGWKGKVQIMSDSRTALNWIDGRKLPSMTKLAALSVSEIEKCGFYVEFRWVPGHSVVGNKLADKLALEAASRLRTLLCTGKRIRTKNVLGTFLVWPRSNQEMVRQATLGCLRLRKEIQNQTGRPFKPVVRLARGI